MSAVFASNLDAISPVGDSPLHVRPTPQPEAVARQFDTMLVSMLLKEARIGSVVIPNSKLDFGVFAEMFTQQIADLIASQNNMGFGASLLESVTKNEEIAK